MNWFRKGLAGCLFATSIFAPVTFAHAAFHLFQIGEVYSNASGSVQFVELFTDQSGQQQLNLTNFKSNSHTFTFPAPLSSTATNNKHFILATPGYRRFPAFLPPTIPFPRTTFSVRPAIL